MSARRNVHRCKKITVHGFQCPLGHKKSSQEKRFDYLRFDPLLEPARLSAFSTILVEPNNYIVPLKDRSPKVIQLLVASKVPCS